MAFHAGDYLAGGDAWQGAVHEGRDGQPKPGFQIALLKELLLQSVQPFLRKPHTKLLKAIPHIWCSPIKTEGHRQ